MSPDVLQALQHAERPAIIRGAVRDWPLVQKGLQSADAVMDYLSQFAGEHPLTQFSGPASMKGRFFYNEARTGFNFEAKRVSVEAFFDAIKASRNDPNAPHFYVGSTDLDRYFPGLRTENDLLASAGILQDQSVIASLWMGNRTTAAAHYDMSNNIACCLVGQRRFTLFPPDQIANLYPGPLEPTPAGQVVSMVDFDAPDFETHPGFREALASAQVADLEPGDLLYYPALWWHQVEALDAFNVMVNYWWNEAEAFMDTPMLTLMHGLLSLRDRTAQEKAAWKALFDYYVFGDSETPRVHLPDHMQGPLADLDAPEARRLRAALLKRLNR
ncbi:cupin-like domain-containing protein [Henriciella sp. AS95]|uniref:cupin-like domain-containing protein n=1 Tax=Henriciella sp. AS95 TaxID=3135782 RepID=UPI00317D766F